MRGQTADNKFFRFGKIRMMADTAGQNRPDDFAGFGNIGTMRIITGDMAIETALFPFVFPQNGATGLFAAGFVSAFFRHDDFGTVVQHEVFHAFDPGGDFLRRNRLRMFAGQYLSGRSVKNNLPDKIGHFLVFRRQPLMHFPDLIIFL